MTFFRFLRGMAHRRTFQRLKNSTPTRQQRYHVVSTPISQRRAAPQGIGTTVKSIFSARFLGWLKKDGLAFLGIIVILFVGVWYVGFHSQRFLIRHVEISGNQFVSADEIKNTVNGYLLHKSFLIVPQDTFWTVRAHRLEEALQESLKDQYAVEAISVTTEYPDTIRIILSERIPSVTWVTTDGESNDDKRYYVLDEGGVVTQQLQGSDQINPAFPLVRDHNRTELELGTQAIGAEFIRFLLAVHPAVQTHSGLGVDYYIFPSMTCQKQEYVAEKIFQQEILNSSSSEFKEKKRSIQEQFQRGELTIDQSLEKLEQIKNEEIDELNQNTNTASTRTNWATVFTETECNFAAVGHEVHIVTTKESGGFEVYIDTTLDMTTQLQNVRRALTEKISDRSSLSYIDARYTDRVYYK